MKIKKVKLDSISQDPANLRKHGERNIDAIVASLRKFGQQHPIVIDSKGIILSGNGRYMAAVKLGWQEIEVVESSLTGSSATAYAIADNRTAELAEWDTTALAETLRALQSEEFDTDAAGYSESEIDALVEGLGSELLAGDKEIIEDTIPEPPVDPITKAGDLWILGEHRLLCGDSTNADDVARLMDGAKADLLLTDPPYGISWNGDYTRFRKKGEVTCTNQYLDIQGDSESFDPFRWMDYQNVIMWGANLYAAKLPVGTWLVWDKRASDGSAFLADAEVAWSKGGYGVYLKSINQQQQASKLKDIAHPTKKPVELFAWCIERCKDAKTLFDPYCGSGTAFVAAEQLNRKCFGIEISPQYCDVIVKRWENLTGMVAVRETSVKTPA